MKGEFQCRAPIGRVEVKVRMILVDVDYKATFALLDAPLACTKSEAESFDVAALEVMRQGVHKGSRIAME